MKTRLFLTVATFIAMTLIASAQTKDKTNTPAAQDKDQGIAWVDANNNGVCDNFENGVRQGRGQRQGQGQAYQNGRVKGMGRTQGTARGKGMGRTQGTARGKGPGRNQGPNFIDENKNGVCDYRETPVKK
jgi:hypothetical protein